MFKLDIALKITETIFSGISLSVKKEFLDAPPNLSNYTRHRKVGETPSTKYFQGFFNKKVKKKKMFIQFINEQVLKISYRSDNSPIFGKYFRAGLRSIFCFHCGGKKIPFWGYLHVIFECEPF